MAKRTDTFFDAKPNHEAEPTPEPTPTAPFQAATLVSKSDADFAHGLVDRFAAMAKDWSQKAEAEAEVTAAIAQHGAAASLLALERLELSDDRRFVLALVAAGASDKVISAEISRLGGLESAARAAATKAKAEVKAARAARLAVIESFVGRVMKRAEVSSEKIEKVAADWVAFGMAALESKFGLGLGETDDDADGDAIDVTPTPK